METGLQKTLKLLKKYEGFRDTVYLDGNGIPTIGYGFTDPALIKKGKITLKEADSRLTKEIATRYNTLKDTLPNFEKLSDDSKAALISYHFNYPAGFKDTTRFMKYWNAGDYEKAIKEVDAGMNDPKNPGLRPRRLEELAILSSDPFISGIIATRKRDGNKILKFPVPEQKPFESAWKPEPPINTIYPLNNTTPESISSWSGADAPNATPRLKDFLEVRQEDLNRGIDVYGDPVSPFSLRLRLPSLTSLLQLNSPLKLAELYFADALGISDMLPLTPNLFPRLKNGKLPRYEDGKGDGYKYSWNSDNRSWDRYTNDPYAEAFNNIVVTPKTNRERFNYEKQPSTLRTPNAESDLAYTLRRIEETTKNSTPISDAINLGVGFIPGVGDARDAIAAGVAGTKGDYTTAGLLGAGLLMPNVIQKPILFISKGLLKINPFVLNKIETGIRYTAPMYAGMLIGGNLPKNIPNYDNADKHDKALITGYGMTLGAGAGFGLANSVGKIGRLGGMYKVIGDIVNNPLSTIRARSTGDYPITFSERRNWINKKDNEVLDAWRYITRTAPGGSNFSNPPTYTRNWKTDLKLINKYSEGDYRPYSNNVRLMRRLGNSNLPFEYASDNSHASLAVHEFTHYLLHNANRALNMSKFDNPSGYYVLDKNNPDAVRIFAPLANKKAGEWTGSPNEFTAEFNNFKYQLGVDDFTSATKDQQKRIIKLLSNRFDISKNEVKLMINDWDAYTHSLSY